MLGYIVVSILVVIGIIIAISEIHEKRENKIHEKNVKAMQEEYDNSLKKFRTNTHVCNWAQEVSVFIQQDVCKNKYKRNEYDVCGYTNKIKFINLSNDETVFVHYFAKCGMKKLCDEDCFYLVNALALNACEQLEKCGIQAYTENLENHVYVDDDENELDLTYCTIVCEGEEGENDW